VIPTRRGLDEDEILEEEWPKFEKESEGARHDGKVAEEFNELDDEMMACQNKLFSASH